jgi:ligand-binding sensor domain-containing protein
MRCVIAFHYMLFLLIGQRAFCQEYGFTHYDIGDGLASSTVYCITQDREGFIWVGTEAGVCRFDGIHFRTFTTADGLPDAEILHIFGDSRGRVWMAPFRKSICYYSEGRMHNVENDSLLSSMGVQGDVQNFAEDAHGNILILQKTAIYVVRADGGIKRYDSAAGEPITRSVCASRSAAGNFNVQIGDKLFGLSDSGFSFIRNLSFPLDNANFITLSPSWSVVNVDSIEDRISSLVTSQTESYRTAYPLSLHVSFSIVDDSLLFLNQLSGVLEYSMSRGIVRRRMLPGVQVSRTFGDHAGNLWFTTLGKGIFRLNSDEIRTIRLPENGFGVSSVHSIALNMTGDGLLIGDNHNVIYSLAIRNKKLKKKGHRGIPTGSNRILFIHQFGPETYIWGGDNDVDISDYKISYTYVVGRGIKSASVMDANRILLGGLWGAGIFDLRVLRITDLLWGARITAVYCQHDTSYFGTMQGLWQIAGKKPAVFMGSQDPFLRSRVAALTESDDGTLWIASYDDSVIGYANGRVVATITSKQGLTGNVCHCLFLHDHILWVGTDKGLYKIELDKPGYPVTCYTSNDGLASDIINVIYAVGSTIYVGSSAGLSYFDETKVHTGDECRLNLLGVISAGQNRVGDTASLLLPVSENNIRFEFAGISYRSVGKISYRYRLIGLDSTWKERQDNYLDYPTLPAGRYEFQVQAINRFGTRSELLKVPFEVATPFWNRFWFNLLEVAILIAVTWLFIGWRTRRVRRQQEQKAMQSRRMAELEHIALQAQMNPHFIFNCLNSIQQFVFDKDMMATNEYISSFARLIRATLNHSSRPFISVAEEVEYLSDYLALEKMRFKEKMDYVVDTEPELDVYRMLLPPMLLQPYVENCVRHGLRHKTSGQGYVRIHFRRQAERLVVTIRDNGIGRKRAMEYKTGEHIEYQSKGMSLTSARIQMINVLYKSQIDVSIEDLHNDAGRPEGTRIVISFPVFG